MISKHLKKSVLQSSYFQWKENNARHYSKICWLNFFAHLQTVYRSFILGIGSVGTFVIHTQYEQYHILLS